jgi:hypothetical protein
MPYRIGFWNLENLFAPEHFPHREPWIAPAVASDLRGWTEALFQRKVSQRATGITQLASGTGPDLLDVCEVENRFALDALVAAVNGSLPSRNYGVIHADSTRDRRGIDTAFLFDQNIFTVDPTTVFSHFVMRRTGTRDITQATFRANTGHELVALCNHWPSRCGGVVELAGFAPRPALSRRGRYRKREQLACPLHAWGRWKRWVCRCVTLKLCAELLISTSG